MASNYTPEEIEQLKAREADEIKRLGQATIETRMALLDAAAGVKGFTANLTKGFGSLGTSALGLTKQLAAGEVGASVFNNSIGSVANALGDLLGLIPYVGGALKTLVKGASEYTQAVNKQADLLYKNYQDMSQMGATAADGMQGVYNNLKRMNYGTEELDKFVSIVKENSQTLAHFGGTVNQGLGQLAAVSQAMKDNGMSAQFQLMGMSIDDINKGVAGFTKMQSLYGTRQRMSTEEQTAAAANYIKEIDLLAKITGKNREQQQALEESAMAEERFAGYRQELKKRAEMGDLAATEQIKTVDATQKWLADQAPETRKGFLNILSNTLDTPEAKKLLLTMPEAAAVAGKKFFTATEFQTAMLADLRKNEDTANQLAQIGVNDSTFIKYNEQLRLRGNLESGLMADREKQAKKDQTVTDKATQNLTDINIANRNARDSLQDLINAGIPLVTTGMKGLAGATEDTIKGFEKMAEKLGITVRKRDAAPAPAPATAPAAEGARVSGSAEARASAEKYFGKAISDDEFSALIKATHAEAAGGKQASQQEQAMIMASILNRARTDKGGIMGALTAKNQFQSVTGTANAPGPSQHYLKGPEKDRLQSIEGATQLLQNISTQQKNFTAASAAAYGAGTNIGYRDKMLAAGGTIIGGSVFQTAPMQAPAASNPVDKRFADMAQANRDRQAATATDKRMANGGVIPAAPGGVSVVAGEAGMNEAFVPLPDGRSIPVQIAGTDEQMSMMSQQLNRLDDLVRIMQNQLGVSQKLLKYAQ